MVDGTGTGESGRGGWEELRKCNPVAQLPRRCRYSSSRRRSRSTLAARIRSLRISSLADAHGWTFKHCNNIALLGYLLTNLHVEFRLLAAQLALRLRTTGWHEPNASLAKLWLALAIQSPRIRTSILADLSFLIISIYALVTEQLTSYRMKEETANDERFRAGAAKYAAYLETPEGRLRLDLAFSNLKEFLPHATATFARLRYWWRTGAMAVRLALLGHECHVAGFVCANAGFREACR